MLDCLVCLVQKVRQAFLARKEIVDLMDYLVKRVSLVQLHATDRKVNQDFQDSLVFVDLQALPDFLVYLDRKANLD